jgi:hypothetical protein
MHNGLGIALFALGLGLIGSGIARRRARARTPIPSGAIRPEFAAMGEMIRPILLFAVGVFALKISLFYWVFGGQQYLSPFDFADVLFVLATYAGWLVMATKRPPEAIAGDPVPAGERSAA